MNIGALAMGVSVGTAVGAVGYYIASYFLIQLNVTGGIWTLVLFLIPAVLALAVMAYIMQMFG